MDPPRFPLLFGLLVVLVALTTLVLQFGPRKLLVLDAQTFGLLTMRNALFGALDRLGGRSTPRPRVRPVSRGFDAIERARTRSWPPSARSDRSDPAPTR